MEEKMKTASTLLETEDEAALGELATSLRNRIADLENKEGQVGEKLTVAKRRGLLSSANKCRVLLQKLARRKNEIRAELSAVEARLGELEAKREIEEIRALTEEIDAEVFPTAEDLVEMECPSFSPVYARVAKAERMGLIARVFAWTGLLAGLCGALAYLLLVEFNYVHFRWLDLALFGAVVIVPALIGMVFGLCSNRQRRMADRAMETLDAEMRAYEEAVAEQQAILDAECVAWKHANTVAATEAADAEYAAHRKMLESEKQEQLKSRAMGLTAKLGDGKQKMIPVAIACAAVALVVARRSSRKKKAAARREILRMLGYR